MTDRARATSRSDRGAPARTLDLLLLEAVRICEVESFLLPVNSTSLMIGRSSIVTTSVTPPGSRSASICTFSSRPDVPERVEVLARIFSGSYGSPTLMPR